MTADTTTDHIGPRTCNRPSNSGHRVAVVSPRVPWLGWAGLEFNSPPVMEAKSVREFITEQVLDWDDDTIATARFKAFSGQRSDWEPKFHFWRDLILKISRRFGLCIIRPSQVKNEWFNRGGLVPLCLDHVLFLMYNEGDIVRIEDIGDPYGGRLSQIVSKVKKLMFNSPVTPENLVEHPVVLMPLLKVKADEVTTRLSENHWTSSCVVTRNNFESLFGGPEEASVVLSHLMISGRAQYISLRKRELIEGIKVSLSSTAGCSISTVDCDILHLISTQEKLQQQLQVIDRRWEMSRKSALSSLKSGNKKLALRYAKEIKIANENREKCTSQLNRVEEVISVIADAESTKKVSEAIQIGAQAMKENKISVEDVQLCLEELDEIIETQKEAAKSLESTRFMDIEDEEVEEEFRKLEQEVGKVDLEDETSESGIGEIGPSSAQSLSDALSNLNLHGNPQSKEPSKNKVLNNRIPEIA